jgi:hypothetical protein
MSIQCRGVVAAFVVLIASNAGAQAGPDHMQCYRVTDATLGRLKGIVDLDASIGLAPGCKLGKAKLYCVPAEQQVQPGSLVVGRTPVSTLPYHGPPAETDRICYRVKCETPSGVAPDQTVTDEFGTHELRKLRTELMCKPATGGTLPPPRSGFQIRTPEIEIPPLYNLGQCYYFRTSNAVTIPVKRFASQMRPVTKQIVLLTTTTSSGVPLDKEPPGTVNLIDCDTVPNNGLMAQWVYAADTPSAEMTLPADDGEGNPVAIEIPAYSAGYILMHNHNTTQEPVMAQVTINGEALEGPVYTKSSTLMTYEGSIAVPPQASGYAYSRTCEVPAGAKFWRFTTHTHGRAVRSWINDVNDQLVLDTFDWEHPTVQSFPTPPFFTFPSNRMANGCLFNNPYTFTLRTGESYQSEEQCVSVGYFFPATKPLRCQNGFPG